MFTKLDDTFDYEKEQLRKQVELYQENGENRHKERMAQIREQIEYNNRTADTWLEALQKQARLYWREFNYIPVEEREEQEVFAEYAKCCERGVEIWHEEAKLRQGKLAELEAQILALKEETRQAVASRLIEEAPNGDWAHNAEGFATVDSPESWLNW